MLDDPLISRQHVVLDVTNSAVNITTAAGAKNPPTIDGLELAPGKNCLIDGGSAEIIVGDTVLRLSRI